MRGVAAVILVLVLLRVVQLLVTSEQAGSEDRPLHNSGSGAPIEDDHGLKPEEGALAARGLQAEAAAALSKLQKHKTRLESAAGSMNEQYVHLQTTLAAVEDSILEAWQVVVDNTVACNQTQLSPGSTRQPTVKNDLAADEGQTQGNALEQATNILADSSRVQGITHEVRFDGGAQ